MVGRPSNATVQQPNAHLPIDLYLITHSPKFPRGAKREWRDDDGNLLYNFRRMRIHIGGNYTKERAEAIVSEMKKQGIKNIKMEKTSLSLPSKCPRCNNEGTPNIYNWKGTLRTGDEYNRIKRDTLQLIYSHSKTKPKTCRVATVELNSSGIQFKIKGDLPSDCLGYRARLLEADPI